MRRIFAIAFFLLTSSAVAQSVQISLPSQGYYTVGEFLPVQISADADATVVLRADGALDTTVLMHGKKSVTARVLMLSGEARSLRWDGGELAIQVRGDSVSEQMPPTGFLGDAYAPVFAWHPGASPRTRRMVILLATLVSISLCASATLLRSHRAKLIASIAVVVLATLGIEAWRRGIPPIWTATGQIVVARGSSTQIDTWRYFTSRSPTPLRVDLLDQTWPVFIDLDHARKLNARLVFDGATSNTTLFCDLTLQLKLAVCGRQNSSVSIEHAPSITTDSPMRALAQKCYVDRDTSIIGEGEVSGVSDQDVRYRAVILKSH